MNLLDLPDNVLEIIGKYVRENNKYMLYMCMNCGTNPEKKCFDKFHDLRELGHRCEVCGECHIGDCSDCNMPLCGDVESCYWYYIDCPILFGDLRHNNTYESCDGELKYLCKRCVRKYRRHKRYMKSWWYSDL